MSAEPLVLYDYWRSSAAYRVRIALNLKGLNFEQRSVHLVRDGGEQHSDAYRSLNPQGLVPTLLHGERVITQSMAICEYIDEAFAGPRLVPGDPAARAAVRAAAQVIACDVHPLNNLRVQQYLKGQLGVSPERSVTWMNHWMSLGFAAFEAHLLRFGGQGRCCFGDQPTLADVVLVPQIYNARRFGCDLEPFPRILEIVAHLEALPEFVAAAPENQPDAERSQ
ncbi:MAG: maleylacetoacetate isomerase [Xanthomonadales bacterium]|nr:maleylacetoacetate isomerase [Xanthomonadales bacterium]